MATITEEELIFELNKGEVSWNKWRHTSKNKQLICENALISGLSLGGYQFVNILFKSTTFQECQFQYKTFYECHFENSNFYNCEFREVRFNNIKANNLKLSHSKGQGLSFNNSVLESSDLFDHKIEQLEFIQSDFLDIDLSKENALSISISNIKVDKKTIKHAKKNPKITIGLNGIYNQINNSASLITETPKGDEMTGGKEEVILKSLIKAKKAFALSVSLTLITMAIKFIGLNSFTYLGIRINPNTFALYSLPIILFSLYKSNILLKDVVINVKYIKTQTGAMTIGRYPWLLSRFNGNKSFQKIESIVFRVLYCAHPLLLLSIINPLSNQVFFEESVANLDIAESLCDLYIDNFPIAIFVLWFLFSSIIYLSIRAFCKSQKLQKPLLFDLVNPIRNPNELNDISVSLNNILKYLLEINFRKVDWDNLKNYLLKKSELVNQELRKNRKN